MLRISLLCFFSFGLLQVSQAKALNAWDKAFVSNLKSKTLADNFCKERNSSLTGTICADIAKSGRNLNWKIKKVEQINPTTLTLSDGQRSVQIAHGAERGTYIINNKKFDLSKFSSVSEFLTGIKELVPKVGRHSLWMNEANAAVLADLNDAVALVLAQTSDDDTCQAAKRVVQICRNPESSPSGKNLKSFLDLIQAKAVQKGVGFMDQATGAQVSQEEIDSLNTIAAALNAELEVMSNSLKMLSSKKDVLNACPTNSKKTMWETIEKCQKDVTMACASLAKDSSGDSKIVSVLFPLRDRMQEFTDSSAKEATQTDSSKERHGHH